MLWYHILLIVIAATLVIVACLVFALAFYTDRLVFGKRMNRKINLKYFPPEDFGLGVRLIDCRLGRVPLYAAVYTDRPQEECKKVVLFCHGIGAGHAPYMTEIARLCSFGYVVVAYDSIGSGLSRGKCTRGFYANVQSAAAVYGAIKNDPSLSNLPVHLVGHSWGAYAALCLTPYVKARSVVALSAFNSPSRVVADIAAPVMGGWLAGLCRPMWYVINFLRFGARGNSNASGCIERSGIPAFLAYGAKDKTVRSENCPAVTAHAPLIQSHVYDDKGHNVYATVRAQKLIDDLNAAFSSSRFRTAAQRKAFFENFDFKAATEEDDAVMNQIRFFIDSH